MVTAGALVDEVWGADRPPMPQEKVWVLDDKYTGQSVQGKFKDIAAKMSEGCDTMLVTALDDVAWMLNLRGNDIEYNPLFFSYVLFHREGAKDNETYRADLFIDQGKVQDEAVLAHLSANNIAVHDYTAAVAKLQEYAAAHEAAAGEGAEGAAKTGKKISVDKK